MHFTHNRKLTREEHESFDEQGARDTILANQEANQIVSHSSVLLVFTLHATTPQLSPSDCQVICACEERQRFDAVAVNHPSNLTHAASCTLAACELLQQVPAKIDESTGEKLYTEEQARAFAASLTVPAPKKRNRKPFKKVRSLLLSKYKTVSSH